MSNIIYVVPWAICDTDSIYVKKVASDTVPTPVVGESVDDWCIRNVIPNPDRRSKDIYAIIDVYNGYKEKMNEKGMSVFSLTNSDSRLTECGYVKVADEKETEFIKTKVMKLGKAVKKAKK
ncbi:MAG: hypothetical protein J6J16_05870 [Lachnospiraceae bacterium]|nr:hypothetical protein [Lachnospiraceae bacterium]